MDGLTTILFNKNKISLTHPCLVTRRTLLSCKSGSRILHNSLLS